MHLDSINVSPTPTMAQPGPHLSRPPLVSLSTSELGRGSLSRFTGKEPEVQTGQATCPGRWGGSEKTRASPGLLTQALSTLLASNPSLGCPPLSSSLGEPWPVCPHGRCRWWACQTLPSLPGRGECPVGGQPSLDRTERVSRGGSSPPGQSWGCSLQLRVVNSSAELLSPRK